MKILGHNSIFLTGVTSGTITENLTASSPVYSRPIIYENYQSYSKGASLFMKLGNDGNGTVKVDVVFHNGIDFMATYHNLVASIADNGEIEIYLNSNDFAIWKPHFGLKFRITRLTGSGDIVITEGRYVPEEN